MMRRFDRTRLWLVRHPILIRASLWLILPVLILAAAAVKSVHDSLPVTDGTVHLSGIGQTVTIARDEHGVPHILAQADRDAFFGLGYAHAQDRLWQMEVRRRLGQGRLAEIMGDAALSTDRYMRALGLERAARDALDELDAASRASLEAYASGVNAWLRKDQTLPIEFVLLNVTPEPWSPQDSLLQIKLMALALSVNQYEELTFRALVRAVGEEKAIELKPNYRGAEPWSTTMDGRVDGLAQISGQRGFLESPVFFGADRDGIGSNAWVLSGELTASGKPLLANDIHLGIEMPAIWYLAEIRGDRIRAIGATIPGLPVVIAGFNERIAWGVTAYPADVQDLYQERLHITDANRYEVDGAWREVSVEETRISIAPAFPRFLRSAPPAERLEIRRTHHGPLITADGDGSGTSLALSWTALLAEDTSYESFLEINYADDWSEFSAAASKLVAPTLAFAYADVQGNIGFLVAGRVPGRHARWGWHPIPGWDSRFDWDVMRGPSELPRRLNPADGVVVLANARLDDDVDETVSFSWAPGYRARRFRELLDGLLNGGSKVAVQDLQRMQGDQMNLQARELVPFLLKASGKTDRQRQVLNYVASWDYRSDEDSIGAAVFHVWARHFSRELVADELLSGVAHSPLLDEFVERYNPYLTRAVASGEAASWCDDTRTDPIEDCLALAESTLSLAIDELDRHVGRDVSKWRWGRLQSAHYPHSLFADTEVLDLLFSRTVAAGGDSYTIDVAQSEYERDSGYRQVIGAGYRQVIDLGDWSASGFISSTGQSGNFVSQHYADFLVPHDGLELVPMTPMTQVGSATALVLEPLEQ